MDWPLVALLHCLGNAIPKSKTPCSAFRVVEPFAMMKTFFRPLRRLLLVAALAPWVIAVPPQAVAAESIGALHRQALEAEQRGDWNTAIDLADRILARQPNHFATRDLRARVVNQQQRAAKTAARGKLAAITIENIDFDGVELRDVLEFLRRRTAEAEINFVVVDPTGQLNEREITGLRLRNVPATVVLEYLAEAAEATVQYRAHDVVLRPRETTPRE